MKLQSFYFNIEADSNDNVTRVTCKIYSMHLSQIQVKAKGRKLYGAVLALLLKYADGLDSTHKGNIDKHGKSGEQHDSSVGKFNYSFVANLSFHVSK